MPLFTSVREKHLWLLVCIVLVGIAISLFASQHLLKFIVDQDIQAGLFLLGMFLVLISFISYGLKLNPANKEVYIWFGIIAVYLMVFLRLNLAERSHLIEYSILSIFFHTAITERLKNGKAIKHPIILSFIFPFLISLLDEIAQIFIPYRVFDPLDIIFNAFAIFMALSSIVIFSWIRNLKHRPSKN